MTGEPHTTTASAIVTWGAYLVTFGSLFAYGIRAKLRETRERREREAAEAAERLRQMRRRLERRQPAPLASVGARIPARSRQSSLDICESIWNETLVYGERPDLDLLAQWDWWCSSDEATDDDDGIAW